jgi:uncharacterized membrane protein YdcZ (DUF606 family)
MTKRDETTISEDDVRTEHLQSAQPGPHWAYLAGVLGGSFVLMLAFLAWLGS